MGIYNDGNVYGVLWNIYDDDGNSTLNYDIKYEQKMTREQIDEVKKEYDKLTLEQTKEIQIKFYTKATTSYEPANSSSFMMLWPGTYLMLEKLFLMGDIVI